MVNFFKGDLAMLERLMAEPQDVEATQMAHQLHRSRGSSSSDDDTNKAAAGMHSILADPHSVKLLCSSSI